MIYTHSRDKSVYRLFVLVYTLPTKNCSVLTEQFLCFLRTREQNIHNASLRDVHHATALRWYVRKT